MLLNMIAVGKVSMYIDFQENEVMQLFYGTLQLNTGFSSCQEHSGANDIVFVRPITRVGQGYGSFVDMILY